ncbi:NUDIX domain-containing protein [Micromonospora sp. WMMD1102]|uniref:NUDIX hydrolase n=1 Tax=Micromonospora sp. WMMD1102 TaxID=3016105 RepID=UPI002414D174|nr:NUDIX domain-containing protein [Micromonospora sp. WMMD1102]MDG4790154.1 NUDIX domain-containing protein [Micromonospora sp. WMMD1102]
MTLLDVVNELDEIIGQVIDADRSSPDQILRFAFVVLANESGQLLLHQRSPDKEDYPLYWSGSAAGHPISGASYQDAASRELMEELGIRVSLKSVGKFYSAPDRRMVGVFYGRYDGPVKIDRREITRVAHVDPRDLMERGRTIPITSFVERSLPLILPLLEATDQAGGSG